MFSMFWKFIRLWSLRSALCAVAVLGVAAAGYGLHGDGGPPNWGDGGVHDAPGGIHGAPGPVVGAGLPLALIAVGYGVYRLVRRRRNSH
jgi:hypothetical protein